MLCHHWHPYWDLLKTQETVSSSVWKCVGLSDTLLWLKIHDVLFYCHLRPDILYRQFTFVCGCHKKIKTSHEQNRK
jgi:hypothetical protein